MRVISMCSVLPISALMLFAVKPAGPVPHQTPVTQQIPADADPLVSTSVGLGKQMTVIVVMAPDCAPCVQALPFYQRLISMPNMDGVIRRLVVIAQNGVIPMKRVLDANKFTPHALTSGPSAAHEITQLPTLVLLDGHGHRVKTWSGPLTTAQEAEVVAAIGRSKN